MNSNTEYLTTYIDTWCNFNKKSINDISDLEREGINEYLKLKLQE